MNRMTFLLAATTVFGLPATAQAETSVDVRITAHVDPFCRIYPPETDSIEVRDGSALIGNVREICNTPEGYQVETSFSNLSSGVLMMTGGSVPIIDGMAVRSSDQPAARTMLWSLNDAHLNVASEPVIMQVTISPR